MRVPNFFIVGAPRCGTTAMWSWLRQHPEVFMPRRKEPHFFGRDLAGSRSYFVRDPGQYRSLFLPAAREKRVGEASVFYLYSREAAADISRSNPSAKIVVMLRNPVDVMHSLHAQLVGFGIEDIPDFEAALGAEEDRRRGRRRPRFPGYPVEVLYYRAIARFAPQVSRYLDAFGRDGVHVVLHDDLKRDPARVFRSTCAFLGVDPAFQPAFRSVNSNRRAPMSASLRLGLEADCAEDVSSLSRLLGRPLGHWLTARGGGGTRQSTPRRPAT